MHAPARVLARRTGDDEEVGIDPVDHPLVLDIEGALLSEREVSVHEGRPVAADVVVRGDLVEDGGRAPGAVEAHVGDGEVRSSVGAREGHGTVDERSLGGVRGRVRGEGLARGHGDGHGGLPLGGHGHRVRGERQVNALPRPVGRVVRQQHALDLFGQRLATQGIGARTVGDVREGDLEGPPGGALTQVGLGTRRVRRADDGREHKRGRGPRSVNQAGTHSARRVEGTVILLRVRDRAGSAHQELRDDGVLLGVRQTRERRVGCHALTHEGSDRGGLTRGLGRTGLVVVVVSGRGGRDPATGCCDLGLEPQVRGGAGGGEVRRGQALGHGEGRGSRDANLDRSSAGGLDRVVEAVAIRGRDGPHRDAKPAVDRPLHGGFGVVPVAEQNAGGLARQGLQGLDLVLDLHVFAPRVGASQLFEEDRVGQVPVVRAQVLRQVFARAVSGVDDAVGSFGKGVKARSVALAHAGHGAISDQVIAEGDGSHDLLLVDRGDREG